MEGVEGSASQECGLRGGGHGGGGGVDKSRAWFERWGKGVEAWVEGQRVEGGAEGEVAAWFEK